MPKAPPTAGRFDHLRGALAEFPPLLWSFLYFFFLLTGAIAFSTPLVFGALAGVLGERVGVVNIAIEGQLLMGALFGILGILFADPILATLKVVLVDASRRQAKEEGDPPEVVAD